MGQLHDQSNALTTFEIDNHLPYTSLPYGTCKPLSTEGGLK